jgi:HlyD family secretion protein
LRKYTIIILVILLALGGAAVWYFGFRARTKPLTLDTIYPQYGYISNSVSATGTIQPVDTVTIGSQVSGTIKAIYADFNDHVRKGQLIAELDKSLYLTTVNQFIANRELARSSLLFQQNNFAREKQLYDARVISKSEFETATSQTESAKATLESVQAQLDGAQKNLSYTNIYSPVDGVVLFRNIGIGQTVAASFNTPTLFIIAKDIKKMQVQAAVDEADIGNIKTGLWSTFTVDAFPDFTFSGQVREIRLQPVVSSNVVTYTTIIDAPNNDLKLKPGMTANIFIYTKEDTNALLIPSKALRFEPDSPLRDQFKIFALDKHIRVNAETSGQQMNVNPGSVKSRGTVNHNGSSEMVTLLASLWVKSGDSLIEKQVHTGINDDTHVQILDGLSEHDLVVLGIAFQGMKTAVVAGVPASPFMPARRATTPSQRSKSGNR